MSSESGSTPAGWYPDPQVSGTMRYWDGAAWSEHTAGGYDHAAPSAPAVPSVYAPYQRTVTSRPRPTFVQANTQSLVAIAFAVGYFALAATLGIVMLGIIPLMAGIRALSAKEPLAPLALVAGIVAILAGIGGFFH